MAKAVFGVGEKFACLTIIAELPRSGSGRLHRRYLVKCECGTEKSVLGHSLRPGNTVSCGCHTRRRLRDATFNIKHGEASGTRPTPEYTCWKGMKKRCVNPNFIDFEHYGGRGIKVCERWIDSYDNFLSDMGRKPSAAHSIDRINVNGNYEPSNCRWATQSQQNGNRRTRNEIRLTLETQ